MSHFTREHSQVIEFDGDSIEVSIKRLKKKDLKILSPFIKDGKLSFEENIEFVETASPLLKKSFTKFEGLTIEGKPVTLDELLEIEESYFIPLIGQLTGVLMECSFPKGKDEKKSEQVLDDSLSEPDIGTSTISGE